MTGSMRTRSAHRARPRPEPYGARVTTPDTGSTAWLAEYEGLDLVDATALAERQAREVRVIRPGDAITLDLRPQRLNLELDSSGELLRVRAG